MTDLIDIQKETGIGGETIQNPVILKFTLDKTGHITSRFRGRIVFRDVNEIINQDETWICSVQMNPSLNTSYIVTPIQKIDADYIYKLLSGSNKDELVKYIVENPYAQDILKSRYDETKSKSYEDKITELNTVIKDREKELSVLKTENKDMRVKVTDLTAKNKEFKDKNTELKNNIKENEKKIKNISLNSLEYKGGMRMYEKHLREIDDLVKGKDVVDPDNIFLGWCKQIIDFGKADCQKLTEELNTERTNTETLRSELTAMTNRCKNLEIQISEMSNKENTVVPSEEKSSVKIGYTDLDAIRRAVREEMDRYVDAIKNTKYPINRISGTTLECKSFRDARYNVLISADKRTMVIRPDDNGNILCINGQITLYGFDTVIPFKEKHSIIANWQTDGSAIIELEG